MVSALDSSYSNGNAFQKIADEFDNPFASAVVLPHAVPTMVKNGIIGEDPDGCMRQALGVSTVVTSGTTTHPPLTTSTVICSTPLLSGGISHEMRKG